jgi:hypothetical protein
MTFNFPSMSFRELLGEGVGELQSAWRGLVECLERLGRGWQAPIVGGKLVSK